MAMKTGNYNVIQSAELDEYELEKEWQDINWHYGTVLFHTDASVLYRPFRFIHRILLSAILFIAP